MITIAYDLPFVFRLAPSRDDAIRVRVAVTAPEDADPNPLHVVWAHLEVWVGAAMYGMSGMSAPRLSPSPIDPHANLTATPGVPMPNSISFEVRDVEMSLAYFAVLLHKLYGLQELFDVTEVAIQVPASVAPASDVRWVRGDVSDLPGRPSRLPFGVDDTELPNVGDALVVAIDFDQPLGPDETATFEGALEMWYAQLMQGGYISPPFDKDNYFCALPEQGPLYVGSQVQWALDKIAFDLRGLDGLLGFLTAFSTGVVPIRQVVFD